MMMLFFKLKASIGNASRLLRHHRALITNSSEVSQIICYNRASFSNASHDIHQTGNSIANSSPVSQVLCHNRAASITYSSGLSQTLYYNQYYDEAYFVRLLNKKIKVVESRNFRYKVRGDRIHASLVKNGMKSDQILCRLLRLYASCGGLIETRKLFYECYYSRVGGLAVWNAAIIGLGLHHQGLEAIQIFNNIPRKLVRTPTTYWNVLVACSHQGEIDFAHYVLGKIYKNLCIEPTIEHIGTYVDCLARNGHLKEAYTEVCGMVYTPSYEIIVSILSRCQSDISDERDLAIKFVKYLEKQGVSYRL